MMEAIRTIRAVKAFTEWLEYLDSYDGLLQRTRQGQFNNDADIACTIPTPPGKTIITVGDLRVIVKLLKKAETDELPS